MMRKNLTDQEAERVCEAATLAAKKFVQAAWHSNWNAAALDHLQHLDSELKSSSDNAPNSGEPCLRVIESQESEPEEAEVPKELLLDKSSGAQKVCDELFLIIFQDMNELILDTMKQSVESILSLSGHFLEDDAERALQEFYQLYFNSEGTQKEEDSQKVNDEVGRLVDMLESGQSADDLVENEEEKERRLGLSSIQKRLETIVSLDESLREKLAPVLTTMQFEDLTRHRLQNLEKIWVYLTSEMLEPKKSLDQIHEHISRTLTSVEEVKHYYSCFEDLEVPEALLSQADSSEGFLLF